VRRQLITPEVTEAFLVFSADVEPYGEASLAAVGQRDFQRMRGEGPQGKRRIIPLDPGGSLRVEFYIGGQEQVHATMRTGGKAHRGKGFSGCP
jgi:hypothetical protein